MKLLALTSNPARPGTRYRVRYLAPHLEQCGWQVTTRWLPKSWRQRRACWRDAARFDVVLVQKKLLQPWEWSGLRRVSRRLVFDFDDAILFNTQGAGNVPTSMRYWKFRAAMHLADLVVAGNAYLADLATPFARCVTVLPTGVPVERYYQKQHRSSHHVVLGWIGSRSTAPYLEALIPVLEELHQRRPEVRLKVVADVAPSSETLPIEAAPWSEQDEVDQVASFDIGLMPLPDNPWTRGKCGLKLLQYLAAGVPAVCSAVGANTAIIRHGSNGYLVRERQQWIEYLQDLVTQPSLRARLGAWGRQDVEVRFSLAWLAQRLAGCLDELAATGVAAVG